MSSHQYYAAVILATRDSARALQRMARLARAIRSSDDIDLRARLFNQYDRAHMRYLKAQQILASHRPLTPDDIAARVASYPGSRES